MPESPKQPPPGRSIALAFAAAALAQILRIPRLSPFGTFFLSLFAVLSLGRVFAGTAEADEPVDETLPASHPRLGLLLAVAGFAGAVACSLLLHRHFARSLFTVLVAGPISLAILGFGADLSTPRRVSRTRGTRAALWPLLLVLLLGAAFRFGSLGWFPPPDGFSSIEEMQRASGGASILDGARPWEFPLAQYLDAAAFALFGKSIYAVRLPATILAWLTLPVFYLLARLLVGRQAALFATALLAVSRWHCQIGWYNEDVYVPLFPFVVLLYLLVRTRRDPRPSLYIAAGAICGYMLYDYAAFRSAPFVALGFFAADALGRRRWPTDTRSIALLFAVVLLFAWPLLGVLEGGRGGTGFYFEALDRSFAETGYYTSDPTAFVRRRLIRLDMAADVFTTSDHFEFFPTLNLPYAPLLDPFTSVFFVLGFGTTILLWRRRLRAFVGLGFVALAIGAMILPWNLDFRRLAILVPFVFLFTAFLAEDVQIQAERGGWSRSWRGALIAVVFCATAANAWFLFGRLATDHTLRAAHRTPYTVVLSYLRTHYDGEYLLILSREMQNFFERNDYDWLKPPVLRGRMAEGVEDLLDPVPAIPHRRDLLLLIARPYDVQTVMSQVREVYPNSSCELRRDPDDQRHDLGVCRVPR